MQSTIHKPETALLKKEWSDTHGLPSGDGDDLVEVSESIDTGVARAAVVSGWRLLRQEPSVVLWSVFGEFFAGVLKFVPLVSPEQVSAAPRDPRGVQHAFNVFRERQGDHVTAMIVGYRFGNLNFDYFDSRETQAAVALVTPSGRSFTMPLPVEIEESIRGTLPTTADQGWVSQYNLWTFLRCEVAAKSPIVSPRHHLSKIWTEEFQSGEMNAADMVNRHADGDGHRRGVFRD